MKRRSFILKTGAISGLAGMGIVSGTSAQDSTRNDRQYYELRRYFLLKQPVVENYLQNAYIPTLNRLGVKNIGVFNEVEPGDPPSLYVLIPYRNTEQFVQISTQLANDKKYQEAGKSYLNIAHDTPAYSRIESSFMLAFSGIPTMEIPSKKNRIFELRVYESHNELAAKKKIEMFNKGEISIFRKVGLNPVFFGETLIGPAMPNLTYMLTFADQQERDKNWDVFVKDPDWIKLRDMPEYANTVSAIRNTILTPTAFSQI